MSPLPPRVQLGSARKAGNNAKEQKNALDAAQSQSESTSLASCRHPPPPEPLAGESTAAAKRIVLQITAGCAGGRADAANRAMWRQQQRRRRQTANKFRVEMRVACSVRNTAEHEHESLHVPIPMPEMLLLLPEMPQLMLSKNSCWSRLPHEKWQHFWRS